MNRYLLLLLLPDSSAWFQGPDASSKDEIKLSTRPFGSGSLARFFSCSTGFLRF
jgi:hypothetical protein